MTSLKQYLDSKGIRKIIMAIAEKYWDPNGIWRVTTEADEEGRNFQTLGVFNGYINEIAFALADKAYHSLTFTKLDNEPGIVDLAKVDSDLPVPTKPRRTVSIKLDAESGIMNLSSEDRTFILKLLLRDDGVIVSEGRFEGSVWLTEQQVSVKNRLPKPNVQLRIRLADNKDNIGGGAAMLGDDGKWYWTYNGKKDYECKYPVAKWEYMYAEDEVAMYNEYDLKSYLEVFPEIIMAMPEKYWYPNGIWRVTTEADKEGLSSQTLGTFNGHINEIAFALADKAYHSLTFTKLDIESNNMDLAKVDSDLPVPTKPRRTVSIKLDAESGIMNIKPEDRTFVLKLLLRDYGVTVREGQFEGSVLLKEELVSVKNRLPKPNVPLWIHLADNKDNIRRGPAMLGDDGKWYWTDEDREKDYECKYPVTKWVYMRDEDEEAMYGENN